MMLYLMFLVIIYSASHVPMRIHCHNVIIICDVIWHALLQIHNGYKKEQHCGTDLYRPGDVFHPDFQYGKPAYFDVTVHHPPTGFVAVCLQPPLGLLLHDGIQIMSMKRIFR